MTKGPLRILARVGGPQQSYRVEIYGAAIGTAIAANSDKLYIDNMTMTKHTDKRPTRECSYSDVCHKVCDHMQHKRVIME